MAGAESSLPDKPDIEAFILSEYVPAKPLDSNLEVCFTDKEQVSALLLCGTYLIPGTCRQPTKHVPN